MAERKPVSESGPPLRQVQPLSSVVVVAFRGGKGCHGLLDLSASESVQVMRSCICLCCTSILRPSYILPSVNSEATDTHPKCGLRLMC